MWDMKLQGNISIYLVISIYLARFTLFSEHAGVIPAFCGSLHCARHTLRSLEMGWSLFFFFNVLFCFVSVKLLICAIWGLYSSASASDNFHVQAKGTAARNQMHWIIKPGKMGIWDKPERLNCLLFICLLVKPILSWVSCFLLTGVSTNRDLCSPYAPLLLWQA